jgi:hypothetical protein
MKDLYRCLDECSPELLQVIAEAWHTLLIQEEPRDRVAHLAQAMLRPQAAQRVLQELSVNAQNALGDLVRAGGALASHHLALTFGEVRRFGPARLARERPWLEPANALEELLYKGLIFRAYATVGDYYGEVFLVPEQLLKGISPFVSSQEALEVHSVEPPKHIRSQGDGLAEDIFTLLVHARQELVAPQGRDGLARLPALASKVLRGLSPDATHPDRLMLLRRIIARLRLLADTHGALRPSLRARDWLRLPDARRRQLVYESWKNDPHWRDLSLVRSIQCDQTSCAHDPLQARRVLLDLLARCPDNEWLSLQSLAQHVKRHQPDFLRPDGDYTSWLVRDVESREYLAGMESWDRIEGALLEHLLTRPLYWLGIVELGYDDAESAGAMAFHLTQRGHALLTGAPPSTQAKHEPLASIAMQDEDIRVTIPVAESLYERYQLERFAEWIGQDDSAIYCLCAESVWRGQNAGIKVEGIQSFLQRISPQQVTAPIIRTLSTWGASYGRVSIRPALLLQTADAQTMQKIREDAELQSLLGDSLGPTLCSVPESNLDELIRRLKAQGVWPQVRR